MATGSVVLFNIEATRSKFANLYEEIFNIFVKAIKWYGASSGQKAIKSINSNYNEEFARHFERNHHFRDRDIRQVIIVSMAEARDIRLKADATDEDIQAIRKALHEASIAAETQARATAELDARNLGLRQQNAGISYQPGLASDLIKGTYERETLQMYSQILSDYVLGQDAIESLLDVPQAVTLPNEVFPRLRQWISSDQTEILWVAGPNDHCYPSKMSAIAATMVKLFADAKPMVVLNFCDLPNPKTIQDGKSVEEIGLISMVYSMIQQLVEHVPPQFDSSNDFGLKRFTPLDGNISTLDVALKLFRDFIPLCLPYIVFIIDGIEWLDYRKGQQGCKEFVNTLRQLKTMTQPDDNPQCVYKVLFTTAGKPGCLMQTLECKEILLQDVSFE